MNQSPRTLQSFTLPEPAKLYTSEQVWQAINDYIDIAISNGDFITRRKAVMEKDLLESQLEDLQNTIKALIANQNLYALGLPMHPSNIPLVNSLKEKIAP